MAFLPPNGPALGASGLGPPPGAMARPPMPGPGPAGPQPMIVLMAPIAPATPHTMAALTGQGLPPMPGAPGMPGPGPMPAGGAPMGMARRLGL